MNRAALAFMVFCFATSGAQAGPNAGGTIIVHNANLSYAGPGADYCGEGTPPADCLSANTQIDGSNNVVWVWKVYCAFPTCGSSRLKTLSFGINYGQFGAGGNIVITDYANVSGGTGCLGDPAAGATEIKGSGWPNPGAGDVLVWQYTQTSVLVEAYWFAGYSYYGAPDLFSLGPHPVLGGTFADDGVPPSQDPIAGYGSLGFNRPGSVACPAGSGGACCFCSGTCTLTCEDDCQGTFMGPNVPCDPNPCDVCMGACCLGQTCYFLSMLQCLAQGGIFQGYGTSCDPNPCPVPVPTRTESWGRIKLQYR